MLRSVKCHAPPSVVIIRQVKKLADISRVYRHNVTIAIPTVYNRMFDHIKLVTQAQAMGHVAAYIIRKLLNKSPSSLAAEASRSFTICDGGYIDAIHPFILSSHLARIRGSRTHDAKYVIAHDLYPEQWELKPVTGYWLHHATLMGGSIYAGRYRHELRNILQKNLPKFQLTPFGKTAHIHRATMISTCAGSTWWGHWIQDEVPLHMLAANYAPTIAFCRKAYSQEQAYRGYFDLPQPQCVDTAIFDALLIIDDFAQNPIKTKRYKQIRQRFSSLPIGEPKRIYLRRGSDGERRVLTNEIDIIHRLESMGFIVIDVLTSTVEQVINACNGASIVISIEGSHIAPLIYLIQRHGLLIILNPPYRVATTHADIGIFCGFSSAMFICEPDGNSKTDFRADPDELCRYIDAAQQYAMSNIPKLLQFEERIQAMDTSAQHSEVIY